MRPITRISAESLSLGEGPLWHPLTQRLYVTDIRSCRIWVLDVDLQRLDCIVTHRPVTALTWQRDGSLLCFQDRGTISSLDASGALTPILELPEERDGLFNDVIADCGGRVLCGAQPTAGRPGRLYCIERDRSYRVLVHGVGEPNGLGFSPDQRSLYFSDSGSGEVWRYEYDPITGTLGERSILFVSQGVLPDGLTVDNEGMIWIALWGGRGLVRLNAAGQVLERIELPAVFTTAPTFGGHAMQRLFVTSAQIDQASSNGSRTGFDGHVFALDTAIVGREEFPSAIALQPVS